MKLTPRVQALGLRPEYWATQFTINSKHVMHMEMARRVGYIPTLSRGPGRDPKTAMALGHYFTIEQAAQARSQHAG